MGRMNITKTGMKRMITATRKTKATMARATAMGRRRRPTTALHREQVCPPHHLRNGKKNV